MGTREVVGPPAPVLPLLQVGAGIPSIPPKSGEICVCPPILPWDAGESRKVFQGEAFGTFY